MKKYCPLTKEIAFARLDKRLSEEDKKAILKAKDMIEFHFSLGMWIRNTWIYGNEEERVEALAKDLGEDIFWDADSMSSAILDGYKKHLKKLSKQKKISPMGRLFEYKCKSCGYTVNANPKGHDAIMMGEQYTYHCEDCKEIVYVVCPYDEKPQKAVCPECGSENLKKWNPRTGKCPICGDVMEKTDIVIMAD